MTLNLLSAWKFTPLPLGFHRERRSTRNPEQSFLQRRYGRTPKGAVPLTECVEKTINSLDVTARGPLGTQCLETAACPARVGGRKEGLLLEGVGHEWAHEGDKSSFKEGPWVRGRVVPICLWFMNSLVEHGGEGGGTEEYKVELDPAQTS